MILNEDRFMFVCNHYLIRVFKGFKKDLSFVIANFIAEWTF